MKLTATEQGLLLPKEILGENQEFEIVSLHTIHFSIVLYPKQR
jgi:hypothetical protein